MTLAFMIVLFILGCFALAHRITGGPGHFILGLIFLLLIGGGTILLALH